MQPIFVICSLKDEKEILKKISEIKNVEAFLMIGDSLTQSLCKKIQEKNIAVITTNEQFVNKLDTDGLQIDYQPQIKQIKQKLSDKSLGVVCSNRDEAMRAGEQGADYILFKGDKSAELASWWVELFNVPCISENEECKEADFKIVNL
ncbi:MAG: hypothetical protein MJ247_06715 [Alphaproteobacteria bacterium]|nr:hypothetical protein [Alphaproteobacteria bacterium]